MKKVIYQTGMAIVTAIIALFGQLVIVSKAEGTFTIVPVIEAIPGMIIILIMVFAGLMCKKYFPLKIPAIAYVVLFGCLFTIPGFIPGSEVISAAVTKVNFMALTTPVQAYVGLSLAKSLPELKKASGSLLVVTVLTLVGTFLCSALIADVTLHLTHAI